MRQSVPGLRIRVGASGSRTFVLRKTVAGRYRNVTLGRYCKRFGLAEARKKARQLLSEIELKADRSEFDLEAKLWTIPRERAKKGTTHLVPLSPAAIAIVKGLLATEKSEKLLPARGNRDASPSGFSKAMARIRSALEAEALAFIASLHPMKRMAAASEIAEAALFLLSDHSSSPRAPLGSRTEGSRRG